MAWVKIDDQFTDHPKVLEVGPLAECLFVRGLCYAARYLTDGLVPVAHLRRMADFDAITEAGKLVAAGLWEDAEGGYQIHDYLDYQPSREDALSIREKRAEAGRIGGLRSGESRREAKPKQDASPLLEAKRSKTEPRTRTRTRTRTDEVPDGTSVGREAPIGSDEPERNSAENPDVEEPINEADEDHPLGDYMPADFAITRGTRDWARKQGRGYSDHDIDAFTETFTRKWRDIGSRRRSWQAEFKSSFRQAMEEGDV